MDKEHHDKQFHTNGESVGETDGTLKTASSNVAGEYFGRAM